ncbi:TonB-dependent receptor plug domain-containing protein [Massilia cavernae]|uniref:TonB-dependent receptor n=1 Tax=Massilia cavernae TaxID=2320864 RepID=A0A418Y170_9BURK|nr:TonB-dependent receptor [Massilia cavernae]RJG19200.1 TonB-dependent receptor [Massilia cavernae]
MHHAEPLRLTLLAAALSLSFSAYGQQAMAPAKPEATVKMDDEEKIQKVEVRGSADTYNPRRDDTASKIVVRQDEIVKYGDTNVLDVMKRLPGVTVSGSAIRMRGLGSGYTQILLNGERPPVGFSIDSLSPDSIETIEVIRAASAEYSTQSIAGTVNIILKKSVKATAQREFKAGLMAGNGNIQPNASLTMSDRVGKFSYSASLNFVKNEFDRDTPSQEEGFDAAGQLIRLRNTLSEDEGGFKAVNFGPRLVWNFENGDTLTSQSFLNSSRFELNAKRGVQTPAGAPPPYPGMDVVLTNRSDSFRTDLNLVKKLGDGAKLDVKAGTSFNHQQNDAHRLGYNAAGALALDDVSDTATDETGYSTTGKYSSPMGEGHALAMGWDAGYTERQEDRFERFGMAIPLPFATDDRYLSEVGRVALWGQDEWNVTPRWSVYMGMRWEGIQTTSSGNTFDASRSRTSVWSPLFQTLYKLPDSKGDQLRLAVTRTYKAPNTGSLIPRGFRSLNNSSSEPDYLGNSRLKPELALGVDASYEHYWAEGALLSVNVSAREIDDYTRSGLVLREDGRWVVMPVNNGKAHSRTIELEAKFPLKAILKDAPAIDVRANIARNWSSVDAVPGPDNRLDNQTPLSANFGFDYKQGALTTGASFNFANGGVVRVSNEQTRNQSVRRDLEAYVLWKFSPKTQLRVAASNILAQDFISDVTYADKFGSTRSVSVFLGGATLRATLEIKF